MGDEFSIEDVIIILRRRLLYFLIPVLALAPLGVLIVMLLPSKYTAKGTILVESAQIPEDLVRSTVNTYAQERIQMIKQRVMTRERLLDVADKYQLFPKELGLSESERVNRMRASLGVSLITAGGARTVAQRDNTIAFNVSYTDRDPDKAFKVANEFMSLFLTEDVRTRTAGASNTTEFFTEEAKRLTAAMNDIEQKIAKYKEANAGALPEQLNMHLDLLRDTTQDLNANEAAIASLDEEIRFLQSQLTSSLAGATGEDGPARQLADLKAQLVQLRAVYKDAHPNVQAVKDQIRALESELTPSKDIQNLQNALAQAETDLQKAEKDLPAGDPRIAEKRAEVARLQDALSERLSNETGSGGDFLTAQLRGRLTVANSRRSLLVKQNEELKSSIADLRARIARTPEVERGLQALTRDRENLFNQYQEVVAKQQDAQLAETLEDDQKAEKFSILEGAVRPEEPSSPARAKLIVLAILGALGAGGAAALGSEFLAATIRGRRHLEALIDGAPIAVIPNFPKEKAGAAKKALFGKRAAAAATSLAFVIAASCGAVAIVSPPESKSAVLGV